MNSQPPNIVPPPLPPRAFTLALRIDNVVTVLNALGEDGLEPIGPGRMSAFREAELWQALRRMCGELSALVCHVDRPDEAAAYVTGYLPRHFEDILDLLFGGKRLPTVDGPGDGSRDADSA